MSWTRLLLFLPCIASAGCFLTNLPEAIIYPEGYQPIVADEPPTSEIDQPIALDDAKKILSTDVDISAERDRTAPDVETAAAPKYEIPEPVVAKGIIAAEHVEVDLVQPGEETTPVAMQVTPPKKEVDPSSNRFVQVAAERDVLVAEEKAKKLRDTGFPVTILKATVRGELFHRVLVGPYASYAAAKAVKQQIESRNFFDDKPFVKLLTD